MKEQNYLDCLVGVFGHPAAENPGVVIQEAAFRALGLNLWRFLTIDVDPDQLEDATKGLKAFKMRGINCTIPHKINVIPYLDELSQSARLIGAVNTIVNTDGKLFGENTGRLFSDKYGMSVLCIRLGAVLASDKPEMVRHFPGYLAQADAVQMVDKCLSAPDTIRFDIFDAISENSRRWRDTSHAKEVLGWKPTGSSDRFDPKTLAV